MSAPTEDPTKRSGTLDQMPRRVLLYELNEVPWEILDLYVAARPESVSAKFLGACNQLTTVADDPFELMPWRTWPSMHMSRYTQEHNAYDQGQDPASFCGTPLWDVVEAAGLPVGIFGVLQSWPPREFRAGGFFVPDCFARTPAAFPRELERFQAFNTAMTRENGFAPEDDLSPRTLARVGVDVVRNGLTPWSMLRLADQLVRERRDRRYLGRRPTAQVLLAFDLFWRLHCRTNPALSIFFTNHVASMMHRFWGDWVPGYADNHGYEPDDVHRGFILNAMDYFDHQLGRIVRWMDEHPETVLVVASSMGQGGVSYHDMDATYVLDDASALIRELGFVGAEEGLAMYPRVTLMFGSEAEAEIAVAPVTSVRTATGPLFRDLRVKGTTLSFEIAYTWDTGDVVRDATWTALGSNAERTGTIADLGVVVRSRPGGGNTAQHVPDGIFLVYGGGIEPSRERRKIDLLDVAPSLLSLLELEPSPDMRGTASIFR